MSKRVSIDLFGGRGGGFLTELLCSAVEQVDEFLRHKGGIHGFVREPHKGEVQSLFGLKRLQESGFIQSVRLTQLALRAVAVYGMAQLALGNAQQHLYLRTFTMLHLTVDHTQGVRRKCLRTCGKKRIYVVAQAQVLRFGETLRVHKQGNKIVEIWEPFHTERSPWFPYFHKISK